MKIFKVLIVILLFVFYSCNSGVKTNAKKVTFGIYEIVKNNEIPDSIIDTLKSINVQLENNPQQPIIGYITKADSLVLQLDLSKENIKLVRTHYPVDKDKKYFAIVAIKSNPVIDNSYIQNSKSKGNNVELYFNMEGAKKWADLTKKNIGNTIVFIIDNQIYAMPIVHNEIRNGVALINRLENEMFAKDISESLNSGISE
jgi:SecD/SecF fusion protein